jgi:TolB protein
MGAIYAMDASGAHIRPLRVSNVDNVDNPTWAPDGLRVAYSGNDHGPGIYITTTANNGTVRVTPPGGSFGGAQLYGQPGWSPDGTAIAYAGTFEVPGNLYVINSDGTGITQLTDDLESGSPSWRPIQ